MPQPKVDVLYRMLSVKIPKGVMIKVDYRSGDQHLVITSSGSELDLHDGALDVAQEIKNTANTLMPE